MSKADLNKELKEWCELMDSVGEAKPEPKKNPIKKPVDKKPRRRSLRSATQLDLF